MIGALLECLYVKSSIGGDSDLGANPQNYSYPFPLIFGIEVLASSLLLAMILTVVYTKGLKGFNSVVIGGIDGLNNLFLAFISGVSMNPARSLAPALLPGVWTDLWLYWTATFVGTTVITLIYRKKNE